MKKVELLQKLNSQGAVFVRHGGKHDIYIQPKTGKEAAVPRHVEINEYNAKAILDLFGNPVGSLQVLHFFGLKPYKNAFL